MPGSLGLRALAINVKALGKTAVNGTQPTWTAAAHESFRLPLIRINSLVWLMPRAALKLDPDDQPPGTKLPPSSLNRQSWRQKAVLGTAEFTTMDDQETVIAAIQEARRILGRNTGSSPQDLEATIDGLRSVLDDDQVVRALERISQRSQSTPSKIVESPWS